MELGEETVRQILVASVAVAGFVAALAVVGQTFGTNGEMSPTGGLALVGLIAGFIVAMALAGVWLERQEFES